MFSLHNDAISAHKEAGPSCICSGCSACRGCSFRAKPLPSSVLTLIVATGVDGRVLGGGAAVRGMFFSTMPAVSPTFTRMGSVSIVIASVALGHSAVHNEEPTAFELPIVEQAHLH
jgi:hypothetical protein